MEGEEEWYAVWIGSDESERIALSYYGPFGQPEDSWHRFLVEAWLPGFSARYQCDTLLDVFDGFRDEVQAMYATLSGTATLRFTEDGVVIRGATNRHGHVEWHVELEYSDRSASRLTFEIRDDQAALPNIVAQIDRLLDVTKYATESESE